MELSEMLYNKSEYIETVRGAGSRGTGVGGTAGPSRAGRGAAGSAGPGTAAVTARSPRRPPETR